jgi:hypothetical protein
VLGMSRQPERGDFRFRRRCFDNFRFCVHGFTGLGVYGFTR